jgi:hypothetical protein
MAALHVLEPVAPLRLARYPLQAFTDNRYPEGPILGGAPRLLLGQTAAHHPVDPRVRRIRVHRSTPRLDHDGQPGRHQPSWTRPYPQALSRSA